MTINKQNVADAIEKKLGELLGGSYENSGQWPRLLAEAALEAMFGPAELRPSNDRGQRWPPDMAVPQEWLVEATRIGLTYEAAEIEAEKFVDYWTATPGKGGRKLNWRATWRNWARRACGNRVASATRARDADRVRY